MRFLPWISLAHASLEKTYNDDVNTWFHPVPDVTLEDILNPLLHARQVAAQPAPAVAPARAKRRPDKDGQPASRSRQQGRPAKRRVLAVPEVDEGDSVRRAPLSHAAVVPVPPQAMEHMLQMERMDASWPGTVAIIEGYLGRCAQFEEAVSLRSRQVESSLIGNNPALIARVVRAKRIKDYMSMMFKIVFGVQRALRHGQPPLAQHVSILEGLLTRIVRGTTFPAETLQRRLFEAILHTIQSQQQGDNVFALMSSPSAIEAFTAIELERSSAREASSS